MDVVKKNILSIVAGAIALLAVMATFYPLSGWFDTRATDAQSRLRVYQKLETVLKKQRDWPKVQLVSAGPDPLDQFPNEKIIQVGRDLKAQVEDQRRQMLQFSVHLNRHELLTPGSLPAPRSASDALKFRQDLEAAVENLKKNVLRGGVPPTAENIQKRAVELWRRKYDPQKMMAGPNNDVWINEKEQLADFEAEKAALPDLMQREITTSCKMYLDDGAVTASEDIMKGDQTPDTVAIWYAQMALWVQQDLATSIAQIDEPSGSIDAALVKRLLSIDVTPDRTMYVQAVTANSSGAVPVMGSPSDALPKLLWVSPTGRVCNALYDVVHWHVLAHVDAARVDEFVKQLETGRFMCVRQVDIAGMDYAMIRTAGFSYGPAATVQVSVDGEELFLREWTVPLMPPTVRAQLGVPDGWEPSLSH